MSLNSKHNLPSAEGVSVVSACPYESNSSNELIKRVCLLLEGTYPYVRGGVSSWVHQIILGLPEIRFDIVFIGGSRSHYGESLYELPENVDSVKTFYLEDSWKAIKGKPKAGNKKRFKLSDDLHESFKCPEGASNEQLSELLSLVAGDRKTISHEDFLHSRAAWRSITNSYEAHCTDANFLNYFWTIRSMHAPIFLLAEIARTIGNVEVVHSISTGYAGLLGAMVKARNPHASYVLTEHGIYTKERKIDLAQADWIQEPGHEFDIGLTEDFGYLRRLWIRFYEQIGRVTYSAANQIIALYGGNRIRQVSDGADPNRAKVVPNGISLDKYANALSERPDRIPPVVGFVGRVVPIKDVKTFIRAMRAIVNVIPDAEGWIVGPTEEDAAYADECDALVKGLGLSENVKFLGFQNVPEMMPKLGLMALTSISEAQPLVLLEAFAAGVPCVATDVGSCREMIDGAPDQGDELGSAGEVVGIGNPQATAEACVRLLTDQSYWTSAQEVGLQRVQQFYAEDLMFKKYREIYAEAGGWQV